MAEAPPATNPEDQSPISVHDLPIGRPGRELSLMGVGIQMLRHRRLFVLLPLLFAAAAGATALLQRQQFSAYGSFTPQSNQSDLSRLAGLAAQFGVGLPTSNPGQSPAFFASLVQSQQLLRSVVSTVFVDSSAVPAAGGRTLVAVYDSPGANDALRTEEAVKRLSNDLSVVTNPETGLVRVWVKAPSAALAQQILARILDLVNQFNLEMKQSQANEQRRFIEERVAQARGEIRASELVLQAFLQRNREYRNSPQLSFEHDRLERDVSMRQQVYTSLSQGYEQARIDAVRNTPVITVVERPVLPARPDSRRLLLKVVTGMLVGAAGALLLVLVGQYFSMMRAEAPAQFAEWQQLSHEVSRRLGRGDR